MGAVLEPATRSGDRRGRARRGARPGRARRPSPRACRASARSLARALERVAVGDDQLKAATDDIVEAPLAPGARDDALNAEPSRRADRFAVAGEARRRSAARSSSGGGGPAWRSIASRSAPACGSSWQSTFPSSMASRITASFWGWRSGSIVSSSSLVSQSAQHQVELPGQVRGVAQARAQPLTEERRGQVRGVADQQHAALAHLRRPASSGTRTRCCG